MAVIEERKNKKTHSYKVTWYHKGKRQKPITFPTIQEAEEWKRLVELHKGDSAAASRNLSRVKHTGPTLQEVFDHWYDRLDITPYAKQGYESYWRVHIGPALGGYKVSAIVPDDIRALVRGLKNKGRAPKTIRNIVGSMSPMLGHAVKMGWINASPYDDSLLPRATSVKPERDKFLSLEESSLIIDGLKAPDSYRFMLATGMRPSEICALDISDVNLDAKQPYARVTKAVKQDRVDGDYIGQPKSPRSIRTVGLPPSAVEMLKGHIEGRAPGDPLFTQGSGSSGSGKRVRLRRKRMYQNWQRRVDKLRKPTKDKEGKEAPAKLTKRPELYSLRHTHASLMLDAGMEIWQLSRHLGHSSVSVTEKHYAHLKPDAHYQAANYAAMALGESPQQIPA